MNENQITHNVHCIAPSSLKRNPGLNPAIKNEDGLLSATDDSSKKKRSPQTRKMPSRQCKKKKISGKTEWLKEKDSNLDLKNK